ncbi:hypothetical protein OG216_09700 [Streptomycetaceae bacterium NBC_01309]
MAIPTPSFIFGDKLRRWTSYSADLHQALIDADLQGLDVEACEVHAVVFIEERWWYVLSATDIYDRPICLPATVIDGAFEVTSRVPITTLGETIHRPDGDTTPHGPFAAQGAVVEIIEKRSGPVDDSWDNSVIVPNEIRINGQPLLAPRDKPVIIHEMSTRADEVVYVTLTLMAKLVSIRTEGGES